MVLGLNIDYKIVMIYNFVSWPRVLSHHSASFLLLHLYDPHQTGVVAVI